MRFAPFLFWFVVLVALLFPSVRRRVWPRRPIADELVKDPVCQTYVVRSRALSRRRAGEPVYFCSAECLRRYGALT
jgi:YHS domain-containing protein